MDFDFEAFLVLSVAVTGAIWLLDHFLWAPKRPPSTDAVKAGEDALREPLLVEYAKAFFPILLIVLLLRSFLVEPFRIPSGSMKPTLLVGDFILVNKFAYGIRLPVLGTKLLDLGGPERGDVAVFRFPRDTSLDYIKRIVGLPGDRVRYQNKVLYINGKPMSQELLGGFPRECQGLARREARMLREDLEGVSHSILTCPSRREPPVEFVVPEGHYFAMGDNRDNSNDSRYWGTVADKHLVGEAFLIWLSWNSEVDGFSSNKIVWDRIGNVIE